MDKQLSPAKEQFIKDCESWGLDVGLRLSWLRKNKVVECVDQHDRTVIWTLNYNFTTQRDVYSEDGEKFLYTRSYTQQGNVIRDSHNFAPADLEGSTKVVLSEAADVFANDLVNANKGRWQQWNSEQAFCKTHNLAPMPEQPIPWGMKDVIAEFRDKQKFTFRTNWGYVYKHFEDRIEWSFDEQGVATRTVTTIINSYYHSFTHSFTKQGECIVK